MRGYIVLCLCVVSFAAPQGYKYSQGVTGVQQPATNGFGVTSSFAGVNPSAANGNLIPIGQSVQHSTFGSYQQHQHQYQQQHQHQQQQQHQLQYPHQQSQEHKQQQQQQHEPQHQQQHEQQHQQEVIVSKRFFIHSAPEDMDEDYMEKHITVGVPKKNYNVVFIKSPSKTHKKTAIKISPAPSEEKTVIYVLSQKSDASDIQAEVVEHPTTTTKPEVFFIKYKTNEEANHAQEHIQAQYDALGGTSQVSDEGIAPVTSVVGSLDSGDGGVAVGTGVATNTVGYGIHVDGSASFGAAPAASSNAGSVPASGVSGAAQNNAYLPPNFY